MKTKLLALLLSAAIFCTGCSDVFIRNGGIGTPWPTPTLNPYFASNELTPSPVMTMTTFSLTNTRTALSPSPQIQEIVFQSIYDDDLNSNWSIQNSQGSKVGPQSGLNSYEGLSSIAFTPQEDSSDLFFSVQESNLQPYLRSQVVGFSFWIYCDTDYIRLSDLAVTITGSNISPYWKLGDSSVTNRYDPIFSETRLYDLGFNADIPPKTWAEVDIVLDDLIYDPIYTYVTGLMIKNDKEFRSTLYVDNVNISLLEDKFALPTLSPVTIITPTPDKTPTPIIKSTP